MLASLVLATSVLLGHPEEDKYFKITVVDEATGRGVPLVELRTVSSLRYFTDSNGIVAFHEPGLMDQEVFFYVSSHGYEFPKDGFGFRGKKLKTTPGGSAKLSIKRLNIAERLYRVTGGGIYADSILTGTKPPLREPLLSAQVLGSDSVLGTTYRGKLYWFWGDTNRPSYPLGNFQVPGATSELPAKGGLDPEVGVNLTYFVDAKGFAKETAAMPGKGPTWMTSLIALPDAKGRERLVASYIKIKPPLTIYARGLMIFDDEREQFTHAAEVDMAAPVFPNGHAFKHVEEGVEYVYFGNPFPHTRVRAQVEHFLRLEDYETFTCLKEGSTLKKPEVDVDEKGSVRWAWRKNAPALGPTQEAKTLRAAKVDLKEARWQLHDAATGNFITAHAGSVFWNAYRKRWVLITVQTGGTSFLGEVWYAEADAPTGPWRAAVKVVSHDRYSFYNPTQHPAFDKEGGRYIYFEGTYSHTFAGKVEQTPRYDYNQIMYKLDLADERLRKK